MDRPTAQDPRTHVLGYLKRRVVTHPQAARTIVPAVARGLLQPAGHAFGEDWLWNRYARGEDLTVWLFSCLRLGREILPPSLDARVKVASGANHPNTAGSDYLKYLMALEDQDGNRRYRYAFEADQNNESAYLPWADATNLLFKLRFVSAGAPKLDSSLRKTPNLLPQHFQRSRILTKNSIRKITDFAADVARRPRAFISYRWQDGTREAAKVVARLSRDGYACWWDRWGMSRSVVEQETGIAKEDVAHVIRTACRDCELAVIVKSSGYGESEWTRWEQAELEKMAGEGHLELSICAHP